jgi:hypothetical protein
MPSLFTPELGDLDNTQSMPDFVAVELRCRFLSLNRLTACHEEKEDQFGGLELRPTAVGKRCCYWRTHSRIITTGDN